MKNLLKHAGIKFLAVLCLFACSDDEGSTNVVESAFSVQVVNTAGFGNVLMDQDFQAMYFFANDVNGESNCNGGCANAWPVVPGNLTDLTVGAGVYLGDFGTVSKANGESQLTYKGWPLYYFSPSSNGELEDSGVISGDGAGGAFYVAKPDYSVMLGRQSVTAGEEPVLYLVDESGVSLYDFINDQNSLSNCTGGCATVWPPFNSPEYLVLPSALNPADFSMVQRDDALGPQLAFKGQPLYHFANDEEIRGNTLGQGGADGKFFVVSQ